MHEWRKGSKEMKERPEIGKFEITGNLNFLLRRKKEQRNERMKKDKKRRN